MMDVFTKDLWAGSWGLYFTCKRLYERWPLVREKHIRARIEDHYSLQRDACTVVWNNTRLIYRFTAAYAHEYSLCWEAWHSKCIICNIFRLVRVSYYPYGDRFRFIKCDVINGLEYIIEIVTRYNHELGLTSMDGLIDIVRNGNKVQLSIHSTNTRAYYRCVLEMDDEGGLRMTTKEPYNTPLHPPIYSVIEYMISETVDSMGTVGKLFCGPKMNAEAVYLYK
jgi:hypothetical protein